MTTKCSGLMGRIFGHKWDKVSFLKFNLGGRGERIIPLIPVAADKFDESRADYLMPGDHICRRCGAVTGEKNG